MPPRRGLQLLASYMLLNLAAEDGGAGAVAGSLFAPPAAVDWLAAATQLLLADAEEDGVGECRAGAAGAAAAGAAAAACVMSTSVTNPRPPCFTCTMPPTCTGNLDFIAAYAAVCQHLLAPWPDTRMA